MFNAYNVSSVATKLPLGIESISSKGKTLYGGTKNGGLVSYTPSTSADGTHYTLYVCKNFLTKCVTQIRNIEESSLIIALCDGTITVHDCSQVNYPIVTTLQKFRNINFFAASVIEIVKLPEANLKNCLCLCTVARRKIGLFYWQDEDWQEIRDLCEMTCNDNVKAAVWCQDGQLALAVRDEYSLLTVFRNEQRDEVPGNAKYLFTTGNKSSTPIIRPLNDTGVIGFCRDEIMYFVTLSGRPAENMGYGHVRWSQIPVAVEYDRPFLLALFVASIEIRSTKSSQLIQTVTLPKPQLISIGCSGCLHVVSNPTSNQTDLYCLDGTGQLLKNNIEKLLKDKDYELAWQLAKNLDEKVIGQKEKDDRILEIRNLYAFHLFEQRHFKDSMDIFGEINAEVLYVIGLFPDLLPEEVRKSIKYPGPIPTDFAKNERIQGLQALSEYLSMVRTNIAKELNNFEKRKNKYTSLDYENLAINAIKDEKSAIQQRNLLQIVDTTLLKCYLQTNDMLVASLLRLPDNRCDVTECENILLKNKKINELFLLYERKELHERALELLKSQFNLEDSPLRGLSRTIHYLQNLGNNYLPLILQFAKWVIKENSSDSLKIFTEDCSEVRALDRKKVLEFLTKEAPDQIVPYLEHIIEVFDENSPEIKDALVRHCFNRVQKHMSEYFSGLQGHSVAPAGQEPGEFGLMRRKLLSYLQLSSRFNAETVLVELPDDVMHEERAILLEKAGRHYEAISVYTNILHDYKKAENHCLRYYQIAQKGDNRISTEENPNLFLCMLYSYVRPNEKKIGNLTLTKRLPNPSLALKVLQDYASKIDVPQAIELLPDDIKLSDLWISIRNVLRAITRKKDELRLRQSLLQSSLLTVERCKMNAQRTKINVTYDTHCSICNKRIGLSAFVYQTNKTIAHYYCLPNK